MIRLATEADLPDIIRMVRSLKDHSPSLASLDYEPEKVAAVVGTVSANPLIGICLISAQPNPVGMIIGSVSEMIFSFQKVAAELAWWMDEDYRKSRDAVQLIGAFEYWAENVAQVNLIQMSSTLTHQTPQIEKFYKRRGYHLSENAYLRKL